MNYLLKFYLLFFILSCSSPYEDWKVIERYPSGITKVLEFKHDDSERRYRKLFYESGKISEELSYLDSLEDGVFISWYENGNKWREMYFNNGILDSFFIEYHPNGILKTKATVKNQMIQGGSDYFTENGYKESWVFFVDNYLYYKKSYIYGDTGNLLDSTELFRPKVEFDTTTDQSKVVITVRLPLDKNIFPIDSVFAEYSLGMGVVEPNINTFIESTTDTFPVGEGFEITYKRKGVTENDLFAIVFYFRNGDKVTKLEGCVYPINLQPPKK